MYFRYLKMMTTRSAVSATRSIHSVTSRKPSGAKNMVAALQASLEAVKKAREETESQLQSQAELLSKKTTLQPKKKVKQLPADYLNDKYRSPFVKVPTVGALAEINGFFHQAQVKLEWTTANFLDIPGEKKRQEEEQSLNQKSEEEIEDASDKPVHTRGKSVSKSKGLPEVVFLGKCNVGKSSLLNGLLTQPNLKENQEFAFASRRAGFTQTMNCFNIGNRFKLIDTPGYGVRGKPEQGRQVMEYLHRRKELRRVYLLIGCKEGFSQDDFTIIDMLVDAGVPFEIVFTKADTLIKVSTVEKHLKESEVLQLPTEPSVIFTSSETSRKFPKRQGFHDLRASIFEACGLSPGIKALKLTRSRDL